MNPETNVSFTWTGSKWEIETEGDGGMIPVGSGLQWTFSTQPAPPRACPSRYSEDSVLLLPKGVCLYLKFSGQKGGDEAAEQWFKYRQHVRPPLRKSPDETWVPSLLDEDLTIHRDSRRLCPCQCAIGDSTFPSLNEAGQEAHRRWSNREENTLNVFNEVRFIHDGVFRKLDIQRRHVLDDLPLPAGDDEDEDQGVFEEFEWPPWQTNPHFPALRSDPMALSGASRRKQQPLFPHLRSGQQLFQQPSRQKQFPWQLKP